MKRGALGVMLLSLLAHGPAHGAADPACTVRATERIVLPEVDPYEKFGVGKLQKLARKNDADALNALGVRFGTGKGVKRDPVKSFGFYKAAAELGHSTAQANLAYLYLNGEGTAQDATLAYGWALKSAAAGDVRGLEFAGYQLGTGLGVAKDLKQAAYCYLLAARRGSLQAQQTLATIYSDGIGIPIDRRQAALWRQRAREAQASMKPWIDESPDPPMPAQWDLPFDYVADVPGNARIDNAVYGFNVSLGASAGATATWEQYAGRGAQPGTVLRSGLPGYDTVVVSVLPKDSLRPAENLLAAARRLHPRSTFAPVPGKKFCVRTARGAAVPLGEALTGYLAYCVRPRDRAIFELATTWKSLALQVGTASAAVPQSADLQKTMDQLLVSFAFK